MKCCNENKPAPSLHAMPYKVIVRGDLGFAGHMGQFPALSILLRQPDIAPTAPPRQSPMAFL